MQPDLKFDFDVDHQKSIRSLCFSPNGLILCTGSWDSTLILSNIQDREKESHLKGHNKGINSVDYSPTGKYVSSGSKDYTIRIWNCSTGGSTVLKEHTYWVRCVRFCNGDEKFLLSSGDDNKIKIWDIEHQKSIRTIQEEIRALHGVVCCDWLNSSNEIISGGGDNFVKIWDLRLPSKGLVHKFENQRYENVWCLSFNKNNGFISSGHSDTVINLYDLRKMKLFHTFKEHSDTVWAVDFSPDGKYLISGSKDKSIKFRNLQKMKQTFSHKSGRKSVFTVKFSPSSGVHFASAQQNEVKIWKSNIPSTTSIEMEDLMERVQFVFFECKNYENKENFGSEFFLVKFNSCDDFYVFKSYLFSI